MKLAMKKREGSRKSALNELRRKGDIPAVLYSFGQPSENIVIDGTEFKAVLRKIPTGRLSTTQFVLGEEGREVTAIVKELQRHPTTYDILHLDFMELKETVRVRVPVEYVGVGDCQGIKLGGFLRPVIRYILVECAANAIPVAFPLDVRELAIGDFRRVSDIAMAEGIRCLNKLDEVAVVIAKR